MVKKGRGFKNYGRTPSAYFGSAARMAASTAAAAAAYIAGTRAAGSANRKSNRGASASTPKLSPALTPAFTPRPYQPFSAGKVRPRRNAAMTRSKSAGFFKKGTRKAANKRYNYAKFGFNKTLEAGGLSTTLNQCYYIGHGTMPQEEVAEGISYAIIKRLLYRLNKLKSDWNETLDFPAGAIVQIIWKPDYQNPGTLADTLTTGAVTANALAAALRNFICYTLFNTGADPDFIGNQGRLMRIIYTPAAGYTETLLLENSKIRFTVKSTMKIQNRTRDSDGGESTDVVDNAPLYGKSYTGKGTGTSFAGAVNNPDLVIDSAYGLIDQQAATNSTFEPPIGKLFQDVKTVGKAHLDPGEIKTSVLNSSGTMFLNTILHMIGSADINSAKKYKSKFGAFRFFALEKMIDAIGTDLAKRIDIAYEHNLNQNYMLLPGTELLTTSVFDKHYKE